MNSKINKILRNLSYTVFTHILATAISIVLILIVPKFVSVEEYGYWQLYIFYSSYISYLSFGLTDGAYLRYGGYDYKQLYKPVFVSQYWFLVLLSFISNLFIIVTYSMISTDFNKTLVILLTCFTGILVVPRSLLNFMLQTTNRIKEYSLITIIERSVYFIIVILFLITGISKFEYLILADIIGKLISVFYSFYVCKELVFGKFENIKSSTKEIWINITVGIKLLIANLASMLIIGIVRFSIEFRWSVETFGKVSLTLSISNMLMLLINAIGLMLFPILRRTTKESLPIIYKNMRTLIIIPILGLLIVYFPLQSILSLWLPQYEESLKYMVLLFPMVIFESKTLLLINTYLKTLRKEKMMLSLNLITVSLSFVLTLISVFIINNLNLAVLSITILLAFRSIISELYLSKIIKVSVHKDIFLEIFITLIFIGSSWYLDTLTAFFIYIFVYILFLTMKRTDIVYLLENIKRKLLKQ